MTLAPPFAYYGGKTTLAERIVDHLPAHDHYVEPYAGSLAVLLAKQPSRMETVNDLDQDLVLFWRVLRDRPDDLAAVCALTPHSRAEHLRCQDALDRPYDDDLERARTVWVLLTQTRSSTLRRTGWRHFQNPSATSAGMPRYLAGYVDRMPPAAHRLRGVTLECRDGLELIADYGQHPNVLLYVDPPYLGSTRARNYRHELTSPSDHLRLLSALQAADAAVVLSGYPSPLYDDALAGWHRVDLDAFTGNATAGDGDRVEVLWSNRPLRPSQDALFGGAA